MVIATHPFRLEDASVQRTLLPLDDKSTSRPYRERRNPRLNLSWPIVVPWTLVAIGVALFLSGYIDTPSRSAAHPRHLSACRDGSPPTTLAPRRNVWKNVDIEEAAAVRRWMKESARGLNLTDARGAADSDNVIQHLQAARPAKRDVLAYWTNSSQTVQRHVHAIVYNGTSEEIIDYIVGPLPISPSTTIQRNDDVYHRPTIPLNAGVTLNWTTLGLQLQYTLRNLDELQQDLFGASVQDGTLAASGVGPMSYDGEWRRTWVQLRRNKAGVYLLPVDFHFYVDMSGTDASRYRILKFLHNGTVYDTSEDLVRAWQRGELKRELEQDTSWTTRRPHGPRLDLDDRSGPRTVAFDGARFRVDDQEDYLTWMGWSFYTSFERDMGLRFWDINFRGDRIIYELSPQEAMAQYSGANPHQATTVWLDRAFGMGMLVREIIPGYDCPAYAYTRSAVVHQLGSVEIPNAICIFEQSSSRPLSRHVGDVPGESGAVKGYELVVRSISTVGNYDYIFDYTFQLDGTIEVRVSASGYLQGGAWAAGEAAYGHRIGPRSMGSLHDHVMNFKVDFDILGARNSLMAVSLETERKKVDWLDEVWGDELVQQRIVRRPVRQETQLDYPSNMQGAYVVTNEEHLNKWGNPRGYVIHPGPLARLTNLDSPRTERNVEWAKHHLAVTRRHEDEPESSSAWNMNLPGKPAVDFGKFFNNESIEQEDLVVWLNLGTHHIPRAEDAPHTLTNLATSYVLLAPWNFNDYDPSIDSRNAVLMDRAKKGTGAGWDMHEAVAPAQCAPAPLPRLEYTGTVARDEDGKVLSDLEVFAAALPHKIVV